MLTFLPSSPLAFIPRTRNATHKNEVFFDLLERMTVLIGANWSVLRQEIDGAIQMKSFLSGMPELKLGLNDKLMFKATGRNAAAKKAVEMEVRYLFLEIEFS